MIPAIELALLRQPSPGHSQLPTRCFYGYSSLRSVTKLFQTVQTYCIESSSGRPRPFTSVKRGQRLLVAWPRFARTGRIGWLTTVIGVKPVYSKPSSEDDRLTIVGWSRRSREAASVVIPSLDLKTTGLPDTMSCESDILMMGSNPPFVILSCSPTYQPVRS